MNVIASRAKRLYRIHYTYYDAGIAHPYLFQNMPERIYMRLFKFFTKLSVRYADDAISISHYLRKELKRDTGLKSKVEYVKIDTRRYNEEALKSKAVIDKIKRLKKKHKINGPIFLYVGRISPHKGIHLLIKAFNLVLKEFPDAKLILVGKKTFGSYAKQLDRISNEHIIFTGFIDDQDLPAYYALCDLYTTATLWEGYDMPVVEAQAMGKQVVAFDLCSHPEVVKNGKLVKPKDINGFAKAIIEILRSR
jgi:1,2-diacylglycerol 3-alpha-glucosyltransferase